MSAEARYHCKAATVATTVIGQGALAGERIGRKTTLVVVALRATRRFASEAATIYNETEAEGRCFISLMKSSTQTKTEPSLRWPGIVESCGMKATKSAALGMLCALGFVSAVAADPPNSDRSQNSDHRRMVVVSNDPPTKYVVLTGSYIPQKVVVRSIGTNTTDPRRIYNRSEIDRTGRVTTEDVLRLDPSLTVISGHASGVP